MTLIRNIKGFTSKTGLKRVPIVVHFTSDNMGETLSLGSENHNFQITVSYKDIERIVERERAKGYKNGHDVIDEGWGEQA